MIGEIDATIPKIAERAGANPTSIYRRWGSRENVLLNAAVTRLGTAEHIRHYPEGKPGRPHASDHEMAYNDL